MSEEEIPYPDHVAIIMDGNGRWAQSRGLPRIKGHEAGAESVRAAIRACREWGIKYLTLYAFSVENWIRPKDEVSALMMLLAKSLSKREHELHDNQIRLRVIGRKDDLPGPVRKELDRVCKATSHYDGGTLVLALSYGGRAELVDATRQIASKVKDGELQIEAIDENTIAQHLYAPDIPDPDLMIRTSGEQRISNFLLWQLSYAELYITDIMWPDFREDHFREALDAYRHRRRRFGGVK